MRREHRADRAVRAVDVKPEALGGADLGDLGERIDRARADRPGAGRDAERALAGGAVGGDGGAERADIHPVALVARDPVNRLDAEAEDLGSLLDAAVAVRGHVESESRACVLKALGPYVPAVLERGPVTRGRQRDQGRRRTPAHQQAHAALGGKPDQLHQPPHGGPLDVDRGVVAARAARIQRRREKIGDDADGRWRRVHPAEEPRVAVAHRVGQNGRAESLQHGLRCDAAGAEWLLYQGGALGGTHRVEDGRGAYAGEVVGHEVVRFVGEPAEVLGVERGRRARVGVRGHRVLLLPPGRAARSFGGAMAGHLAL